MTHIERTIAAIAVLSLLVLSSVVACNSTTGPTDSGEAGEGAHSEGGEGTSGEAEESGAQLGLSETYDQVRNGARLIIRYDAQANSFLGTVENTTNGTLRQVRVEVHLSNGIELGPTTPTDLGPGQIIDDTLQATSTGFTQWSAHPEVG